MKSRSLTELAITGGTSVIIGVAWIYTAWIQPLYSQQYNDHATLSAAVANIKNLTSSITDIQTRVDWLTESKGYSQTSMADTTNI